MTLPEPRLMRADEPYGGEWECDEEIHSDQPWLPEDDDERLFIGFGDRLVPNDWNFGEGRTQDADGKEYTDHHQLWYRC